MKRISAIIPVFTVLLALAVANILAARHPLRLDLTANKRYTLSDATKKILGGLDDVVTVRLYFTRELPPQLAFLRRDADDLLAEFKGAAGRRLQVEHIDPGASPLEEQKAAMIGIPPLQLNVLQRDRQEVAKVFLGMAVLYGDRQQVIPVVQRIDQLEYDLAEAIVRVAAKELPRIAWWDGAGAGEEGNGFGLIRQAIERRYTVAKVDAKTLPDLSAKRFGALILAGPRELSNEELFAIDQYLMGGGRLIALVDRFDLAEQLRLTPVATPAVELLAHYGAAVEDTLVLDQSNAMAAFSGGVVTYHLPYPFWPDIRRGQFNAAEPIVADLETAVFPWTSPVTLAAGDSRATALAQTSDFATQVPGKDARLDPQSAGDALAGGKRERLTVAALLAGPFGSFFSSGKAAPPPGRDARAEGDAAARVFVVGSSHWLTDRLLATFPANAALFENVLDSFAMGDALIGIRSREETARPIADLSDGARLFLRYANVAIGPIAVLAIGVVVFLSRRARRRAVKTAFGALVR